MKRVLLLLMVFTISLTPLGAQEICDNGMDDDGDGLIDLNDDECFCTSLLPSSLIPNPSFEEMTCCPSSNARLDCAVGWIQASNPTTDYVHTCNNYLGNTNIPAYAPLPFPDGEGAVGFRDGQRNVGSNYKEYVGACLTKSMEVGTSYRLDFYVGFRDNVPGSKNLDISIFGSTNCSALPFGNNSNSIGCPANTSFYTEIASQSVSGSNEWVSIFFEFVPTEAYNVIIIGPSCSANPNFTQDPYFYLDGLILAETSEFGIPFEAIEGSICNDDLVLTIEDQPGQIYQWYKDGVAIPGETQPSLNLITSPGVAGSYLVVVNLPDGCVSSKVYYVRVPPYYAEQSATICENEEHFIGNTPFSLDGEFEITIPASDGCDSIITLYLEVLPNTSSDLTFQFCEGDTFSMLGITTDITDNFEVIINNANGCDSIINLFVEQIPLSNGLELISSVSLDLGDYVDIQASNSDPNLIEFTWLDEEGNIIGNEINLDIQPIKSTTFTLVGKDIYDCEVFQLIEILVDKSNTIIHTPNIFSPDGNNTNDYFSFIPTKAVKAIASFEIYDRWGGLLFRESNLTSISDYRGWDGTFRNKPVEQGVYGYKIDAIFLDDTVKSFTGDLTLVRF